MDERVDGWDRRFVYTRELDDEHMISIHHYLDATIHLRTWAITVFRKRELAGSAAVFAEGIAALDKPLAHEFARCAEYARQRLLEIKTHGR